MTIVVSRMDITAPTITTWAIGRTSLGGAEEVTSLNKTIDSVLKVYYANEHGGYHTRG